MNTMKTLPKWLLLLLLLWAGALPLRGQNCSANGNLIIFTNYDGGRLNISVDADIPNLRIGICTYEPVEVNISGPFSGNVTRVLYAGLNSTQNNNNCGLGNFPTSIAGVPAGLTTILTAPPAPLSNPNGNNSIVCAYSCNTTVEQGGCNTIDQVTTFFGGQLGGVLYALHAQYCCWLETTTYRVSELAGSCCQPSGGAAAIAYERAVYCPALGAPQPVLLTGSAGGTFSTAPAGLAIDAATGAITPAGSTPGAYVVSYTLPGCPPVVATTTVVIGSSVAAPMAMGGATYCAGEPIAPLTATAGAGGALRWYADAALTTLLGTGPVLPISAGVGTSVYYVTETADGCESAATAVTVTVNGAGSAAFAYPSATYCVGAGAALPVVTGVAGGTFSSASAGLALNAATGAVDLAASAPGDYTVVYRSPGPCAGADSARVTVAAAPAVSVSATPGGCGQAAVLTATGDGNNYTWSNGQSGATLSVLPGAGAGAYCVTAEANGCTAEACIEVAFDTECCAVFVPNAFSPNDDGVNDGFLPLSGCGFEGYSLRIFDRWGQLVFESENPDDEWNGRFRGRPLEPGVYVYVLNCRFSAVDERELYGSFSLVR
jgi:gliding motility-associated-like protein